MVTNNFTKLQLVECKTENSRRVPYMYIHVQVMYCTLSTHFTSNELDLH